MKPTIQKKGTPVKAVDAKMAVDAEERKRRFKIGGAVIGALLFLAAIWSWWPNARSAKVRQMQEELFAANMSADEKKEKFDALRSEQEKLSPAARKEARKDMGKLFQQKANADAAKYLTLPPADKRKLIDDRLAREQAAPKKQGGAAPGGNGPVAAAGPSNGRGPATPEARDEMRRQMLLRGSAEARAGMDQIKADTALRRAQLGLPAPAPRGGR